jgi:hypothetical protein
VYDATDRGDPEVCLQVRRVIPHQGCDPVPWSEAGMQKTCRQGPSPAVQVGLSRAANGVVRRAGDYFNPREKFARPLQQRRERQTVLHHRSLQIFASPCMRRIRAAIRTRPDRAL